jgi:hypothetical protein
MRTEMKHCSLGQYCLLASGNQPNQNLTQPKIHTRNKGKFLHKRIRSGAITEWKENLVTGPPTAAAHNDQQRKIMAQEKSTWLMDRGLGQGTEFLCGKKINKQAMKIMSFPCRTNRTSQRRTPDALSGKNDQGTKKRIRPAVPLVGWATETST